MIHIEKPHNPMVNAGAILVLSLLLNLSEVDMSLAEKFDWVMNYFKVSPSLIPSFIIHARLGSTLSFSFLVHAVDIVRVS